MKIEICIFNNNVYAEVTTTIELTKKDIEERTWTKHEKVELVRVKKEKLDEAGVKCYQWKTKGHKDDDFVVRYEYSEGYNVFLNDDDERRRTISMLENDKEWKETVERLRRYTIQLLNNVLSQFSK